MKTIILLLATAVSLAAQCGKTVVNPITGKTDCIGGTAVSGIQSGTGAPSAGTCAALANVGKVYVRKDTKASNASLYVCAQTGDGTFGWELGATGADGAGLAGAGTFAEMGASTPSAGDVWVLTDASSPGVCSAGSGTSKALCVYSGSAWVVSSGMIAGGTTGQVPFQTAAGVTGFESAFAYSVDTNFLGLFGGVIAGQAGTSTGQYQIKGTTSGTVTVTANDAAGTWTLKLPDNDGDSGQVLQTNGSGVTSWAAAGTGDVVAGTLTTATSVPKVSASKTITESGCTIDASNNLSCPGTITSGSAGSVAGEVGMSELAENGTNYRSFIVPDALTASLKMQFPDAVPADGDVMTFGAPAAGVSAITFASNISRTIASGAKALATAEIASQACTAAQTDTATGAATTDVVVFTPNADITAVTGYAPVTTGGLAIYPYVTENTVNFKVCNPSSSAITPGAVTINWRVIR